MLQSALHVSAQQIITKKIKSNTYEYCVKPNSWIQYQWSFDRGTLIQNNNDKIRISSTSKPSWVRVIEQPLFPNRIFHIANYGAVGNGLTDDTKAIQKATDALANAGGGTLMFEAGKTYMVTSVLISEGIHYKGNNSTIKRPPNQGKWTRTFRTDYDKTFRSESRPLKISEFTFDGNRKQQGAYLNYELQQAHQIFLACGMKGAAPKDTGRLKVFIEDCHFIENVADGISQGVNVDLTVRNCDAKNVFRGGYVCTGGNSIARIENFTTLPGDIVSGIDLEIDNGGYNSRAASDIYFNNLKVLDGDLDINVLGNSNVVIKNSQILNPPIAIYAPHATVVFNSTTLTFGTNNSAEGGAGAITFPHKLFFLNTIIRLQKQSESTLSAAIFIRNLVSGSVLPKMDLYFKNVTFQTVGFSNNTEKRFPIVYYDDYTTKGKLNIHLDNTTFSNDFSATIGTIVYQKDKKFKDYQVDRKSNAIETIRNATIQPPAPNLKRIGVWTE